MLKFINLLILLMLNISFFAQQAGYVFIENKKQWSEEVKFKSKLKNGDLYVCKDGLLFDFFDEEKMEEIYKGHYTNSQNESDKVLNKHAYKVNFINSNLNKKYKPSQPTKCKYNYFLGKDSSKWCSNANGYYSLLYSNLYEKIDLKLYSKSFHLKYDLVVKTGGNPDLIKFKYDGIKDISIINTRLHVYTSVNHIIEDKPVAFQFIEGVKTIVKCNYKLSEKTISYDFPDGYNKAYDLIIDPTLIFSTYSGSFANNFGYSATFDSKGFLYSGSSVFGSQYPTTLGAYSTNFDGGIVDIGITKFDTSGSFMVYSTYLGGSDDEMPHSLLVNNSDELFIMGTTSSTNFPTSINCYDSSFNGGTATFMTGGLGVNYNNGSDIFISHLSSNGANLLGSTYIGGSDNDGLNSTSNNTSQNILRYNYADEVRGEIEIDDNNNVYIGSCTMSSDFPTTNSSFQQNFGGGSLDGCIFKLDNSLRNLIWSSYLGGEEHDAIYSIALDDSLNVFCTGGTNSVLFPTTNDAYQNNYQGGRSDGFITHISKNGNTKISSTYYGSSEYDQSFFIELDKNQSPYVFGQTEVQDNSFIENVSWFNTGSGQFVSKLSNDLTSRFFSTVFGSGNGINISPSAFHIDLCNKIYLSGWGGAVNNLGLLDNNAGYTSGMPVTPNAFKSVSYDSSDFYLLVLDENSNGVIYGSYFGGDQSSDHVDGGTSRFDDKGRLYQAVCASCGGNNDFPIYPSGAVSATNNSNCNLGVFKMEFDQQPFVLADFEQPSLGCYQMTHDFINTSVVQNHSTFSWDFGDGNTSTHPNPSYTFQNPGCYQVTLVVTDTSSCNYSDTITKNVYIIADSTYTLSDISLCQGENQTIGIPVNTINSYSVPISCKTFIQHEILSSEWSATSYQVNGQTAEYGGYLNPAIMIGVIDPSTLDYWRTPFLDNSVTPSVVLNPNNCFGQLNGDPAVCSNTLLLGRSREQGVFMFEYYNPTHLDSLVSLLDNKIPDGHYIVAYSYIPNNYGSSLLYLDSLYDGWPNALFTSFQNLGAIGFTNQNQTDDGFIFFCQKGNLSSAQTVRSNPISIGLNAQSQFLELNEELEYVTEINWIPPIDLSNPFDINPIASPTQTTNYQLIVSNGLCSDTIFQKVIVNNISLDIDSTLYICGYDDTISLVANTLGTAGNFLWADQSDFSNVLNNFNDSIIQVSPDQDTWYYIKVQSNNCSITDSIIVNFEQPLNFVYDTICQGDNYISATGNTYSYTSTYIDTIPKINSCDSLIILDLTVFDTSNTYISTSACDSYVTSTGLAYYSSGIYTIYEQTVNGCDSIINLDLSINNSTYSSIYDTACGNYMYNGQNLNISDNYTFVFQNSQNCDSTVSLNLVIYGNDFGSDFNTNTNSFLSPPFVVEFYNNTPNPSFYNFTWDFGNDSLLQSNNQLVFHEYQYNGLYSIKLFSESIQNNCVDSMVKKDFIYCAGGIDDTTNISEYFDRIIIYPNPSKNNIKVQVENISNQLEVQVFNLAGKMLQTTNNSIVSLDKYSKGIYILKIFYGDRIKQIKIVKE